MFLRVICVSVSMLMSPRIGQPRKFRPTELSTCASVYPFICYQAYVGFANVVQSKVNKR